jgi:hypothetical protein
MSFELQAARPIVMNHFLVPLLKAHSLSLQRISIIKTLTTCLPAGKVHHSRFTTHHSLFRSQTLHRVSHCRFYRLETYSYQGNQHSDYTRN